MTVEAVDLPALLAPGGALAGLVWVGLWLIRRGDQRDRDAFREVKEQRDEYRARLEIAEEHLVESQAVIARYRLKFGDLHKRDV